MSSRPNHTMRKKGIGRVVLVAAVGLTERRAPPHGVSKALRRGTHNLVAASITFPAMPDAQNRACQ